MLQISANKERKFAAHKAKAMFDYNLAQLITFAFNKPEKMPKAEEVYDILKEERPSELVSQEVLQASYNSAADQALFIELAEGVKRVKKSNQKGGE